MGVLRHSIARALFLPLPLFALVACGITLPEGMTDGDAATTTPTDARVPEVDATTADSSVAETGVADDAASSDAAPDDAASSDAALDAGPIDSGFDAGPPDAGPVDSGPAPCIAGDNEKQPIVDAALARCNALTNRIFDGANFAPQFAVGTYCDAATKKRIVLCLFQPTPTVSGLGVDDHCSKATIQEGATNIAGSTYYRFVSGATGTKTSDPDPAVRRLSVATSGVSQWARQTGGAANEQVISLDKDGKVEAVTPDVNNAQQKAACNFVLK